MTDTIDKCYKHTSLKLAGEGRGGLGWDVGRGEGGEGRKERGEELRGGREGWVGAPFVKS